MQLDSKNNKMGNQTGSSHELMVNDHEHKNLMVIRIKMKMKVTIMKGQTSVDESITYATLICNLKIRSMMMRIK